MKSVAGSYHQGNTLIYGSNGYQCTANALAALIFSSLFTVSEWRTHDGPQGFWGSGDIGYLFSGSWGALVITLGELGGKLIILGI